MTKLGAIPPFRAHPLLQDGHAQTIFGALVPGARALEEVRLHTVKLADGDAIVLHDSGPADWRNRDPVALLMHGLGGCHRSGYMLRVAAKLIACGFRTFRMDHRAAGAAFHLARLPYHAGLFGDAMEAWRVVDSLCPGSEGAIVGFSLSGNIALGAAAKAEWGDHTPTCAVAVNPPVDLAVCSRAISRWHNRMYERHFVRLLCRQLDQRMKEVQHTPKPAWTRHPRTLREFDHSYTAHVWGFNGVDDYYSRSSTVSLIPHIAVPTLLLTARDDSLVPCEMFESLRLPPSVTLHVAGGGGHLGYIGRRCGDPDRRWMDWRIVDWLCRHCKRLRKCGESLQSSRPAPLRTAMP
jgi:predicted alpha/beta-fold hydrolase